MILKHNSNGKTLICSICGHEHTINDDGTTLNEPFEEYYRKIVRCNPESVITNSGLRKGAAFIEHTGYTCPKCNTLQIVVKEI